MPKAKRTFLEWNDFAPDLGEFGHDRLTRCDNVAPAFGNFYPLPKRKLAELDLGEDGLGFHVHQKWGTDHELYAGTEPKLYRIATDGSSKTDVTRSSGGSYAADEWAFTSFGQLIVACDFEDPVQSIVTGAANFDALIDSDFKPRGRYPFSIKGNLFISHCNLPADYDTLSSGNNPYLYCWSATDAPASFGSANVDPQLVGAGFQQITNDLGYITGAIGGDYGLVFQEQGIVRVDGPPYAHRTISALNSTKHPYSIVKVDQDVYFWGRSGPALLRGGEGPAINLGHGRVGRYILDDFSGFADRAFYEAWTPPPSYEGISAAYCSRLSSIVFAGYFRNASGQAVPVLVLYNIREDRFSYWLPAAEVDPPGIAFMRSRPEASGALGSRFLPTSALVSLGNPGLLLPASDLATFEFGQSVASLPHTFRRAYIQLDPERVTRVLRVRPVHRLDPDASALTLTATLRSINSPSGTPKVVTSTTLDAHGWVVFDDSIEADFHQPEISYAFDDDASPNLMEAHGVEVEWVAGGSYGA